MANRTFPEEYQLSNGINVVLQHYEGPVAATYWWNAVGSADERKNEYGFAHFLEHMHFKDSDAKSTGRASTGKLAQAVESMGGDINAYTSFDQTVYYFSCAEQYWEKVLDVFGKMAKPQKFLKQDFVREKEVILEELKRGEDSPGRQIFQSLFSSSFKKHPYGRPVIGFKDVLVKSTVSQLEAFYQNYYVPENMGLAIVGPLDHGNRKERILKILEKRFGVKVLKPKKCNRFIRLKEREVKSDAGAVLKPFDVQTPGVALSFRVPGLKNSDIPALDILTGVLSLGESSKFYQNVFHKKGLVTDVSGSLYVPKDPGVCYFQFDCADMSKVEPMIDAVFEEFKNITENGVSQTELERVITNIESEKLYANQTADGLAGRLGFSKFVLGDLNFDSNYLEQLKNVTAADLSRVARKYFSTKRMNVAVMVPKKNSKVDLTKIKSSAAKWIGFPKESKKTSKPQKKALTSVLGGEVKVEKRPSGITLLHLERPSSHVCSIHAAVMGGSRLELGSPLNSAESDWGVSNLLAMTWDKGTSRHSGKAIAEKTEGLAAGIEGFSGRNSIGLQLTGLARDWFELSQIYSDVLTDPIFSEAELAHSVRVVEDSIKGIADHSAQQCVKNFLGTLFENHPYGRLIYGSLNSVSAMTPKLLKDYHRAWVRPERLFISVVGAVSHEKVAAFIKSIEMAFENTLSGSAMNGISLQAEKELKAPRWVNEVKGREQVHLIVGGLGMKLDSQERYSVRLMNTLLGGQSGRLFIELREKKSLAYSVSPVGFEGLEEGYMGTYIACSPSKEKEAQEGIVTVLEKLVKQGFNQKEMDRARQYYFGQRAMDLQSDGSVAAFLTLNSLYGLNPQNDENFVKEINKVTSKSIQSVCRKYLVEPPQVTSSVG